MNSKMNSCRALIFFAYCCVAVLSVPATKRVKFSYGNNTYEISDIRARWVDAKNDCSSRGLRLVSIESAEEYYAILDNIIPARPNEHIWTSGTDLGQEGDFYWEGTGALFGTFTKWAEGEPSNDAGDEEHCVQLWHTYNYEYNDENCKSAFYYICEGHPCAAEK